MSKNSFQSLKEELERINLRLAHYESRLSDYTLLPPEIRGNPLEEGWIQMNIEDLKLHRKFTAERLATIVKPDCQ